MSWNNILGQCFFAVLVTGATGSIMLLIWFLFRYLLQNKNPKLVYYMLRWVICMFLLPITYHTIVSRYEIGYIQSIEGLSKMMFVMDLNHGFFQILSWIWLIMTIRLGVIVLKNEIRKFLICRESFEDDNSLAQMEFERIKQEMGIKGKVTLLYNDIMEQNSPFVVGIWHPKVVIPYGIYEKEELSVIFHHELNHIKKHDILFRYLVMLAMIANSINPFVYLLLGLNNLWSEVDCDAKALDDLEYEGITKKQYYNIILNIAENGPKQPEFSDIPMLIKASTNLQRRIVIMGKYRTNMKKVVKSVTFAWVMVFVMISSVTAHAAGIWVLEQNDEFLKENQVVAYQEDDTVGGWSEVMTIEDSNPVNIVYINDGIMTLGTGNFDWNVPVGTRYVTNSIYLKAGQQIQVVSTATPTNCLYWLGIMHPSSAVSVVEGTGTGGGTFTISSTGYYRVLIENRGSTTLHAVGSYQY